MKFNRKSMFALSMAAAMSLTACGSGTNTGSNSALADSVPTSAVAAGSTAPDAAADSAAGSASADAAADSAAGSADTDAQSADSAAAAQSMEGSWTPTDPIYIIGQSEAGSGPDMFVRNLQPFLQEELGTAIVVENAPGSGGKIACTKVWKEAPDGYNLLSHSSPLTTVTQITGDAEFDIKSFEHIISFDLTPYCLIVKKGSPITSVADLIEASKTQTLVNANSGLGGAMYLQSMIMKSGLGIEYAEVPFNGANPCVLAVMNGDVTHSVLGYDTAINNQEEVTILAVMSDERLAALPEVPTMKELGYDFPELTMRRGIVAPPGTPKEVVDTLVGAFDRAVKNPGFQEYIKNSGMSMDVLLGEDYKAVDEEYYNVCMEFVEYLK